LKKAELGKMRKRELLSLSSGQNVSRSYQQQNVGQDTVRVGIGTARDGARRHFQNERSSLQPHTK